MSLVKLHLPEVSMVARSLPAWKLGTTDQRNNNFDTIRTLAALAVLVSHSFIISYGSGSPQPLEVLSRGQTQLGSIAVLIFFVMSGYLVTQSFDRRPDAAWFLKARALRIFPGLLAALLLTALALGPAVTSLPFAAYFEQRETASYVPANMTLVLMQFSLPGAFADNPEGSAANRSLWTLKYEFFMYVVVMVLGMAKLLNRATISIVWLGAVLVHLWLAGGGPNYFRPLSSTHVGFAVPFLSGAALYLWRDRVPLRPSLAVASAMALAASLLFGGFHLAFAVFGAYLVIFLALSPTVRLPKLARKSDLSYGTYIYAWPVQQTATYLLGPSVTWYWNALVSLPVVLGLAWLSWHLVEKPALEFKRSTVPSSA